MGTHVIAKGLDLPITGEPAQTIENGAEIARVALLAADYPLMKARMAVSEGDTVQRGQLLFDDRKSEGVRFTSPGAGVVRAIHRGEKRALISVVIELSASERSGRPGDNEFAPFEAYGAVRGKKPADVQPKAIRALLAESGLWAALRSRPFGRVPPVSSDAGAIFVTAIDTNPLAPDPAVVLKGKEADFSLGLDVLARLTTGKTFVCQAPGAAIPKGTAPSLQVEEFAGKHPAGLAGTHIHLLYPVNRERTAWHLGYQDVVAIGRLFATGRIDVERVVSLAGPAASRPRLVRTRVGADVSALTKGELAPGEIRVVSGSVFYGNAASGAERNFIGRYSNQLSCLVEGREREFIGWLKPGTNKFSVIRAYVSALGGNRQKLPFTTTTNGSHRAMVPIGMYEKVMPLDIEPTFLLRALAVDDIPRAEALGCLELDEEDLALCTFVCPGKEDYGVALRRNLNEIWKEG